MSHFFLLLHWTVVHGGGPGSGGHQVRTPSHSTQPPQVPGPEEQVPPGLLQLMVTSVQSQSRVTVHGPSAARKSAPASGDAGVAAAGV